MRFHTSSATTATNHCHHLPGRRPLQGFQSFPIYCCSEPGVSVWAFNSSRNGTRVPVSGKFNQSWSFNPSISNITNLLSTGQAIFALFNTKVGAIKRYTCSEAVLDWNCAQPFNIQLSADSTFCRFNFLKPDGWILTPFPVLSTLLFIYYLHLHSSPLFMHAFTSKGFKVMHKIPAAYKLVTPTEHSNRTPSTETTDCFVASKTRRLQGVVPGCKVFDEGGGRRNVSANLRLGYCQQFGKAR